MSVILENDPTYVTISGDRKVRVNKVYVDEYKPLFIKQPQPNYKKESKIDKNTLGIIIWGTVILLCILGMIYLKM